MQEFSGKFFAFFYHYKPVVFNRFQSHLTHTLSCVSIQEAKNKNSEILFCLQGDDYVLLTDKLHSTQEQKE